MVGRWCEKGGRVFSGDVVRENNSWGMIAS